MRGSEGETAGVRRPWRPYMGPLVLAGSFIVFWLLFKTAHELAHMVFLAFFSVVLAAVFEIPASLFTRAMPRPAAVLLTFLLLILILAGTLSLVAPLFMEQARKIAQHAPAAVNRLEQWWKLHTQTGILSRMSENSQQGGQENYSAKLGDFMKGAIPVAFGTVAALVEALVAVIIGLYLTLRPQSYADGLVRLFPKEKSEAVSEVLDGMGSALRGWTRGTLLSMAIIGTITGAGLLIVGVEGWFALAVLSFVGEFVPFVGAVLTAVPGVAVGLAESPQKALWVLLVYLATHQLEGHLVQPLVMRKAVKLQPAVMILWQLTFSLSFGFMGLLVATPLLAVIQTGIQIGYQKRTLGR
jgi:predicted PurR-regulated permease PerM